MTPGGGPDRDIYRSLLAHENLGLLFELAVEAFNATVSEFTAAGCIAAVAPHDLRRTEDFGDLFHILRSRFISKSKHKVAFQQLAMVFKRDIKSRSDYDCLSRRCQEFLPAFQFIQCHRNRQQHTRACGTPAQIMALASTIEQVLELATSMFRETRAEELTALRDHCGRAINVQPPESDGSSGAPHFPQGPPLAARSVRLELTSGAGGEPVSEWIARRGDVLPREGQCVLQIGGLLEPGGDVLLRLALWMTSFHEATSGVLLDKVVLRNVAVRQAVVAGISELHCDFGISAEGWLDLNVSTSGSPPVRIATRRFPYPQCPEQFAEICGTRLDLARDAVWRHVDAWSTELGRDDEPGSEKGIEEAEKLQHRLLHALVDLQDCIQGCLGVEVEGRYLPGEEILDDDLNDLVRNCTEGFSGTVGEAWRVLLSSDAFLSAVEQAAVTAEEALRTTGCDQTVEEFLSSLEEEQPPSPKENEQLHDRHFRLPGRRALETFFSEEIVDIVENADKYRSVGIASPGGVLLYGPPGCGKTYAVDRLIEYLGWPVFKINSGSIGSPYIHETGRKVGGLFDEAEKAAPAVVVIDEMEAFLADRRGGTAGTHHLEELGEFLRCIQEAALKRILVIGMTNRLDLIDPAILRRGRFDHLQEVGIPSRGDVEDLLRELLRGTATEQDLDLEGTISALTGRPLSDAAFVVRQAKRRAVTPERRKHRPAEEVRVDSEALSWALKKLGARRSGMSERSPIGFRRSGNRVSP